MPAWLSQIIAGIVEALGKLFLRFRVEDKQRQQSAEKEETSDEQREEAHRAGDAVRRGIADGSVRPPSKGDS